MKQVIDNFSIGSSDYAAFRPESPAEIFDFLYSNAPAFDTAWDCGTGNGQVAEKLAHRFGKVFGTDISNEQLVHAKQKSNITYLQERAEKTSLPDYSIDLVTVAQAIHWFDFDPFFSEVRRVAKPGALIAAWTYTNLRITAAVDEVTDHLYYDITKAWWDKERAYVDAAYKTIPFPFEEISTPQFTIKRRSTLQQVLGYLRTWSGVKHYIAKEHADPSLLIIDDLEKAWGPSELLEVYWPVHMRAGFVK
jgi:ubiquinone/menaquinone biosynthesis C-methylase UbiE